VRWPFPRTPLQSEGDARPLTTTTATYIVVVKRWIAAKARKYSAVISLRDGRRKDEKKRKVVIE